MSAAPSLSEQLNAGLARMELGLDELDAALASGEADRIEAQGQALQRALSDGLGLFQQAGSQAMTPDLRQRLQLAQARVQAQQSAVHRVLASTGRTLGVLFPPSESDTYDGALGQNPAARALGKAYR